jgi:hypothetical protein
MYLVISALVQRFDFTFPIATANDFLCVSDEFGIGTKSKGVLQASARTCGSP